MPESISLTVPLRRETLEKAADFLRSLCLIDQTLSAPERDAIAEECKVVHAREDANENHPSQGYYQSQATTMEQDVADAEAVFTGKKNQTADTATTPDTSTATPPSASAGAAVETDAAGLPHDLRIHASTKTKKVNGLWKGKRNVDPALVEQVEAELRATMGASTPPPPAEKSTTPPPPPAVQAATPPPPPPAEKPAQATAPAHGGDFGALMKRVTAGIAAQKITQADVNAVVASCGVPSLPMLIHRADIIPAVNASFDAWGI